MRWSGLWGNEKSEVITAFNGGVVYLNGEFLPAVEAKISAFDHGFLYGDGIFETMRSYGGHIFLLARHLDRMEHSARQLGIPLPPLEDMPAALQRLLIANKLEDASIRLTLSRGPGPGRPEPEPCGPPTVLATVRPYHEAALSRGRNLIISSIRRNDHSPLSGIKSLNYMDNLLAREEARQSGADDAVLLNTKDEVAETSTANIFVVRQGLVLTPPLESGCLPGITRQVILEVSRAMGLRIAEKAITLQELLDSDEVFITNSLIEVAYVQELVGRKFKHTPGPITRVLARGYRSIIGHHG